MLVVAVTLGACGKTREESRVEKTTVEDVAMERAAAQLEAVAENTQVQIAQVLLETWIETVRKGDYAGAEKQLAGTKVILDGECGRTPTCAVQLATRMLRGKPRSVKYRPVAKGENVWMNVAITDFEDPHFVSGEILATVAFPDDADIGFADFAVVLNERGPDDDVAIAFVQQWLAAMQDKAPAPDAGIDPARVHTEPGCNGRPACVGDYLHALMAVRPTLSVHTIDRAAVDGAKDASGVVRATTGATYVLVEASGSIREANMHSAEVMAAVIRDRAGSLRIGALDLDISYIPGTQE